MRKHGGPPSRRDKHVTLAAISPPGVARGRFVGGQQSGLAGCKPPPLFTRGASSCLSQGRGGFQHQNLQDFTKISRALNKDIFLLAVHVPERPPLRRLESLCPLKRGIVLLEASSKG